MKKIYLLAFIMAGIVAISVYMFASQLREDSLRDDRPRQQIVVAAIDIPADTLIQAEMVTMAEVPAEVVHPQAIRNLTDAIGKISQYPIAPQEAVLSGRLKDRSSEADKLSYALPSGYRAITLTVDSMTGVAGYLTQGDRVDLVVNTIIEGVSTSRFQAENLMIIRLGDKRSDQAQTLYQNVTLAATPEQILRINHAMHNGRISLVLRPITDKGSNNTEAFSEGSGLAVEDGPGVVIPGDDAVNGETDTTGDAAIDGADNDTQDDANDTANDAAADDTSQEAA